MSETRAEIVLDGDVSPLLRKVREAGAQIKQFGAEGEQAFSRMSGPLATLQSKFVAIGAILAGGAVFKEAVSAASDFHIEVGKLSKVMGISEETAVGLSYAMGDLYIESDTASSAIAKLVQTMNATPEKFAALGVALVDTSGKSRDLLAVMLDVNARILQFADGTDRSRAAAYVYGKQWMEVQKILDLTSQRLEEGAVKARALGVELRTDDIKQYRAAMNDVGDVADAMQIRIGMALIPSLKALAVYFAEVGGPVINAVVWGFKHLVQFLDETVTMIRLVWNDTKYVFDQLTTAARQMGASLAEILSGNIGAAGEIWDEGNRQIEARERQHQAEYERINREHGERIIKLWESVGAAKVKAQDNKGKRFSLPDDDVTKNRDREVPSFMATYEARLAEIKNMYEQENVLRQFSKEQELAYWRELQANLELTAKDRTTIAKRTATLELEIRRQAVKDERELNAVAIEHHRNAAMAQVQSAQQAANFQRANGEITKRQLLTLEQQFARQRFEIEYQALLERLELARNDPNNSPAELARIKEQMLEIERQYQASRAELSQSVKQEGSNGEGMFDSIGQSFGNATNNILTRATTWRQQMANVFQSVYQAFVQNLITKPMAEWIASQARMLAIKLGFLAEDTTATGTAAGINASIKATETTAVVTENAVQAGSGAAASQASIPWVGPVLALAAMAAIYAAVMGMRGKKSAARGYDIPKGLNPMVQTHEEEMILPQKYANVIRNLSHPGDDAQEGRGGFVFAPTIKTHDSRDLLRALQDGGVLRKAIEELQRNFVKR